MATLLAAALDDHAWGHHQPALAVDVRASYAQQLLAVLRTEGVASPDSGQPRDTPQPSTTPSGELAHWRGRKRCCGCWHRAARMRQSPRN